MKKFLSILLAVLLFCSVLPVAYADSYTGTDAYASEQDGGSIETRAEQTDWIFRYNSELGIYEKRLWSYTYGRWLTDWITADS